MTTAVRQRAARDEPSGSHTASRLVVSDARRLEGIGQLAAGVAHEINTPTQYIGDAGHFLRDAVAAILGVAARHQALVEAVRAAPSSPEAAAHLAELAEATELHELAFIRDEVGPAVESVIEGAAKIAEIVRAMKALTHFGDGEFRPTDLAAIVDAAVRMTRYETKRHCDVVVTERALPLVHARASDLGQVLVNLIVNARDAIVDRDDTGRGRIEITMTASDGRVAIEVADDGVGLPPGAEDRIFTPFYTTKAVGRGTGQGLALVRRVIEQHGGSISANRREGGGACFRVELPSATAAQVAPNEEPR